MDASWGYDSDRVCFEFFRQNQDTRVGAGFVAVARRSKGLDANDESAIRGLIPKVCLGKFCMRPITIKMNRREVQSAHWRDYPSYGPHDRLRKLPIECNIGCGFMFPENIMTNDMMIDPMIA